MPDAECTNNNLPEIPEYFSVNEKKYIQRYREYIATHKLKEPDTPFLKLMKIKLDSITQEQIDTLRKDILDYIEKNKADLKVSERFVNELTLTPYLKGFLARQHKNPVEKVVSAMEYLSERCDGITDENFPKEFLEFGVNIASGFDVYGNIVYYAFARRNFTPRKLFDSTEKYMAYLIYQLVRISMFTNGFFTMLIDFSGAGVANVDFQALRLLITVLNDNAPACLNRVICHNVHWVLRPAFKVGYALLPHEVGDTMNASNGKDIYKFISEDQLPKGVEGGKNEEIILGRPNKNANSFLDVCDKVNLPAEEATKLIEQFRKALKKNKLELMSYE